MSIRGYFITGTDTDVGKTIVTAGLLRLLRERGVNAATMKPIQTGAEKAGDRFIAPDLVVHHRAANWEPPDEDLALMAPYLYEPACSPHLAGRMANRYPEISSIVESAEELASRYDMLLIEGAGGIHAPIDEDRTMLDLMKALDLPVILVAHRGLGTINHTILSLDILRAAALKVAGVIFNETQDVEPDFIKRDNPAAVEHFGRIPILGNVDYLAELESDPGAAWKLFAACVPGLEAIAE